MKTIIFFSWQHLWSMSKGAGAPSYHHTLMHYINSDDWDVYLLTADNTNINLPLEESKNLFIFKDSSLIEKLITKPKVNHLVSKKRHDDFTKWAVKMAKKIIQKQGFCFLYAYEVWGVRPAKILSLKYNLPLITRFQGTILNGIKNNVISRILKYPHFDALETTCDLIIMTDDGTNGDKVVKNLGNGSPLVYLRNGLDVMNNYEELKNNIDRLSVKKELGISDDARILLMASRLTSWKRVDRGIKAFSEARKTISNIKLLIAGDGDCRIELENMAELLGVKEDVLFLGAVAQTELYKYMLTADIFLSLYDLSNLGNPTFEAMIMGNAIIALNGGTTNTVIKNNENGILLEYGEVDKIPEKIIFLLENDIERNRLAANAFGYAKTNFYTWQQRMNIEENNIIGCTIEKKLH